MATTDEDAAMQAKPVSPQWRAVEELHSRGWSYCCRDASGRRILMTRPNCLTLARVDEDGTITGDRES